MKSYFFQYNNLFLIISILIVFLNFTYLFSQNPDEKNITLNEVSLIGNMPYTASEYFLLKKKILKVYHYIDTLEKIIIVVDDDLGQLSSKKSKKRFVKSFQKELMAKFLVEIKSLTKKEGVILSKLIYRNMGITVFDLIKQYKGSWSAFWWQSLAKLYDGNIKSTFNPEKNKEDFLIEKIILDIY